MLLEKDPSDKYAKYAKDNKRTNKKRNTLNRLRNYGSSVASTDLESRLGAI